MGTPIKGKRTFQAVFADAKGKVFEHPEFQALGMKAGRFFSPDPSEWIKLPDSSELFMLPDRVPAGFESDPYSKDGEPCFAVAAFIPPGHTLTYNAAYQEIPGAQMLPLFAYGAAAFYQGDFYVAAVRVDKDFRHDERFLDPREISKGIGEFGKLFPKNRLIPHLANCATVNACANAKNFFLGRVEAPIPTSPVCNAQCQGCISFQPAGRIPPTQKRITFVPTPEEIAEISLFHISHEKDPLVSFGQGCEGEPTLSGDVIEKSIRLIRQKTTQGILNINTNASRPKTLERLFEAGLNQIRVSTNSVREPYYSRYYQPKGYSFAEVAESVRVAKKHGAFVSLNYLSMPGFTDSEEEFKALKKFIREYHVDMIQWRNLNYDPLHYFRDLKWDAQEYKMLGMRQILDEIHEEFPRLLNGYFNPRKATLKKVHP